MSNEPQHEGELVALQEKVLQMTSGFFIAQSIYIAAKLGIADHLAAGKKHCDELAEATDMNSEALYRFLRALASIGFFAETSGRCFELTPEAACLQTDTPASLRHFILLQGEYHFPCWHELLHCLKSGQSTAEKVYGTGFFQYLEKDRQAGTIFNDGMTELSVIHNRTVLSAYDFSGTEKLTDVGGGEGRFLSEVLTKYPEIEGRLFDLPRVIEKAEGMLSDHPARQRCELLAGSFLDSVPSGSDTYMLKQVIHNWDDEHAVTLLKNCRRALGKQGKLLVIESVVSKDSAWRSKFKDLNMLVLFSGRVRTEEEFRALFAAAGFKLSRIVPTNFLLSVIEGTVEEE